MTDQQKLRVREIIAEVIQLDVSEVQPQHELEAQLGADSLDYTEIFIRLEGEFGSFGSEPPMEPEMTVQDITDLVELKIG